MAPRLHVLPVVEWVRCRARGRPEQFRMLESERKEPYRPWRAGVICPLQVLPKRAGEESLPLLRTVSVIHVETTGCDAGS